MIKHIIFDFGGVLVDLNPDLSFNALRDIFDCEPSTPLPPKIQRILDEYEVGSFGEASFMHRLQLLKKEIPGERDLLDAWNAMLLDLPKVRLDWILELRKKYTVSLLSNTNHTHIEWVRSLLRRRDRIVGFEELYFDNVFYSHKINLRKPNLDIYNHVINELGATPAEAIFIDDSQVNIDGALAAGWQAVRHDPNQEIMKQLDHYLLNY
ncbi:MAG: HAD superfamily hydrolase (TIGR01509 family) [Saprospiraceae bacterium]